MKTMGLLSAVVLLITLLPHSYALLCYYCDGNNYNYESDLNCFNVDSTTYNRNYTSADYCTATFTIEDGAITAVSRSYDSGAIPSNNLYTSNQNPNDPTSRSTYRTYCTEDLCNKDPPVDLKACETPCQGNGACDYVTGECVCNYGYEGTDCEKISPRMCYQCSSEYDATCEAASGSSTSCQNGENYCSISRTTVFDTDEKTAKKIVTTRGCTDELKSGCSFTNIDIDNNFNVQPYLEYTCFETCDTDSCNDKIADAVKGDQSEDMYCVQCSGTSDCEAKRSLCPSGTKFCTSTVVYTISEGLGHHKEDRPHYWPLSVVRGCAAQSATTECKEELFSGSDSVKKVTCSETCAEDGCNTGWPARPKCVICSSLATDNCIEDPPFPKSCPFPYQGYCYIHDEGIKKGTTVASSGYPRRMTRGCSHYDLGTSCTSSEPRETEIESCNRTCTTDGCNVGSGGELPLQTLLFVLLVALSANLLQSMN